MCYFGEDVKIFTDDGISRDGSWRADAKGNAPGIFMPADAKPGMFFKQEVAPEVAEDEATIMGSGPVEVPYDTYSDTIRVYELNPLDGDSGYKFYAGGVGLIRDDILDLVTFTP